MNTLKGNLITLAQQGKFDVIVHGCNCFNTMGAGITKQIKQAFPEAYQADLHSHKGDKRKLGSFTSATITLPTSKKLIVVNAYTQYHWGRRYGTPINYDAINSVFKTLNGTFNDKHIAFPVIGAGLAGGNWGIISKIIDDALIDVTSTFMHL